MDGVIRGGEKRNIYGKGNGKKWSLFTQWKGKRKGIRNILCYEEEKIKRKRRKGLGKMTGLCGRER